MGIFVYLLAQVGRLCQRRLPFKCCSILDFESKWTFKPVFYFAGKIRMVSWRFDSGGKIEKNIEPNGV